MDIRITEDHTDEVLSAMAMAKMRALEKIGGQIEKYAKALCPVDTGALRNSITHQTEEDSVAIGSNMVYAPYIELGTGRHYTPPPGWMESNAPKGSGRPEPWRYQDEEGNWHLGYYIKARPYLRPAVENHLNEFQDIIDNSMRNA